MEELAKTRMKQSAMEREWALEDHEREKIQKKREEERTADIEDAVHVHVSPPASRRLLPQEEAKRKADKDKREVLRRRRKEEEVEEEVRQERARVARARQEKRLGSIRPEPEFQSPGSIKEALWAVGMETSQSDIQKMEQKLAKWEARGMF